MASVHRVEKIEVGTKQGPVHKLIRSGHWKRAAEILERLHPEDAVSILEGLRPRLRHILFRVLPHTTALRLRPFLQPSDRSALLRTKPRLADCSNAYPAGSAGHYLTSNFVSLAPTMSVAEALEEIRRTGHDKKTIDVVYVVAADGTFIKELHLALLVMANPNQLVTEIDCPVTGVVQDKDVLQDVIASFKKHNCAALPVVDNDNRILGIIAFDDVIKAANATATRDIQKFGGMEALDAPYFSVRIRAMLRKRGGWLAFLFLGETLTATAMGHFEKEIASAVVLALFIPLIISSGGNSGSQATSLLIRSLALGEMSIRDWWKVGTREAFLGVSLGAFLGAIGFVRIVAWQWLHFTNYGPNYLLVALTVWLSLMGVVGFGTITGSMLPFLLRRLGFDPATSSSPLVATLVDVTGLIIYFTTAHLVLGRLLP